MVKRRVIESTEKGLEIKESRRSKEEFSFMIRLIIGLNLIIGGIIYIVIIRIFNIILITPQVDTLIGVGIMLLGGFIIFGFLLLVGQSP